MPIHEESFRIGCGRYIQKRGAITALGEEVARLGHAPLVIGDATTLGLTRTAIEGALAEHPHFAFIEHNGTCNHPDAERIAKEAAEGLDVIVGVGGGVIMDLAKLVAYYAKLPVINIPTSSATCAAYAPLSVCYTPEGRTVGTQHYPYEVNAVLVDTEILLTQPKRLFLAGVFDALAKFTEIKHRYQGELDEACPLGLDYAYHMSHHSFELLMQKTPECLSAMERGEITDAFERVIFTTIAATGVISGIARGSNQTALAHKFYEMTRALFPVDSAPFLHGEIVGVGLLLQNHYNGEAEQNEPLLALMAEHGMPHCITDVHVTRDEQTFLDYYDRICHSSSINANDADQCARFKKSLAYFWNIK